MTSSEWRRSYDLGGTVRRSLANRWFLESGVWIANRGYRLTDVGFSEENKIRYLGFPIGVGRRVGRGLLLSAGLQLNFLLSAKNEFEDDTPLRIFDIKDNLRDDSLDLLLGASLMGPLGVAIDLKYGFGVSDIQDSQGRLRNQSFIASVSLPIARFGSVR